MKKRTMSIELPDEDQEQQSTKPEIAETKENPEIVEAVNQQEQVQVEQLPEQIQEVTELEEPLS